MGSKTLLIGNDINNIVPNNSWKDIINDIIRFCDAQKMVTDLNNKPFPLLYEEIFLKSLKEKHIDEKNLKKFISDKVRRISPNEIHERIQDLEIKDVITTNYDFTLEGKMPIKNNGIIDERIYSVFRHYKVRNKNYWHIHGDCKNPNSINLGFEHYGGQLQQIRNYLATGTNYKSKNVTKTPLINRLETKDFSGQSWIELFFNTDIYIFGLSLDFEEIDLWWLLTYRARQIFYKRKSAIKNKIYYFVPKEFNAKEKKDLLLSSDVIIIDSISGKNKLDYYNSIIDFIQKKRT